MQPELDDVLAPSWTSFRAREPAACSALLALSEAARHPGLESALLELVRLRASQVNRCIFCQRLHAGRARALGVREARLQALPVWRTSEEYSERERSALAWCEALTHLPHLRDVGLQDVAEVVRDVFDEDEFIRLTVAIVAANAWNRVAQGLGLQEDEKSHDMHQRRSPLECQS